MAEKLAIAQEPDGTPSGSENQPALVGVVKRRPASIA
jgi:hypothetical protein